MSNPKQPTREQLSKITSDLRVIKAFESLFKLIPDGLDSNTNENIEANAKAVQATTMSQENQMESRSSRVLLWLSI